MRQGCLGREPSGAAPIGSGVDGRSLWLRQRKRGNGHTLCTHAASHNGNQQGEGGSQMMSSQQSQPVTILFDQTYLLLKIHWERRHAVSLIR